jgi:hypothetical protein
MTSKHEPFDETVSDAGLWTWVAKYQKKSASQKDDALKSEPSQLLNEITVTIVCVTRPDKILTQLKQAYRFVKKEAGIYHCDEVFAWLPGYFWVATWLFWLRHFSVILIDSEYSQFV